MPIDYSPWYVCEAESRRGIERQNLGFAIPLLDVLDVTATAGIDIFARLDQDVICGDDIDDRGLTGVFAGDPYGDGDVVWGVTISYGEKTVDAEEELCAPIVES